MNHYTNCYFYECHLCVSNLGCNDTFNNSFAGSVQSPLYPNNYQNSMRCDILIEAPENYTLMLKFPYFNMAAGDSLQVNNNHTLKA